MEKSRLSPVLVVVLGRNMRYYWRILVLKLWLTTWVVLWMGLVRVMLLIWW